MIRLRPATPADADDVARIYIDSWNAGFGHLLGHREHDADRIERWREDLAGPVSWTVATLDDRIVGFVGVGASRDPVDPTVGELHAIAVDPDHWRSRVGATLMAHALGALRASFASAVLWTPAGYDRGHGFYRAMGWTPTGDARRGGSEVSFRLDLGVRIGAAVIVWRRGPGGPEFLLLHRSGADATGPWCWTFPSGGCEAGETLADCAARELAEETGLELAIEPVPSDGYPRFLAEAPAGAEVTLDAEHDDYRWLPLDEAFALLLPQRVADSLRSAATALDL